MPEKTTRQMDAKEEIRQAREVLKIEAEGILGLCDRLGEEFNRAVDLVFGSRGRLIVTGIGKSGIVGRKIVATLSSTGTPSFFLHPVEALHGDLGMVTAGDVLLALSYSGETEVNDILPLARELGASVICITGNLDSTMARLSDVALFAGVAREACPLGLAPTASTTAATAMGDALAVALINRRQFNQADFKRFHPGGNLGERLSMQVREVMTTGADIPAARPGMGLAQALTIMNQRNLGALLVTDEQDALLGIFTDGDLRRAVSAGRDLAALNVGQVMTPNPKTIGEDRLAVDALELMQRHDITVLPIVNGSGRLSGVVHLHALLGKGKFKFNLY